MAFVTRSTHITGYVVTASDWNESVNNDNAMNAFFFVELWPKRTAYAPASGTTPAAISVAESSDAGTNKPLIPIIAFGDAADSARQWTARWPRGYGVSATLVGSYYMSSANVDDEVELEGYLCALSDGDTSATAAAYDSANASTESVPDAAGTVDEFSITLTNADSVAAVDWVSILLLRNGDAGTDTADGNFNLTSLAVNYSFAS